MRSSVSAWLTLFSLSLGYGVVQLDVTIVNVALNSIAASYGGAVSGLQWIVSAYTLTFAAVILTAGALGDRIGARRMFMAGFAVFGVASLACALAPSLGVLIGARSVQGLAAAILVPNSLALVNHTFPDARARGRAVGIWLAGASLALTAGPVVGGVLIAWVGWRSIFLVNVPLSVIALLLAWRYARETPADLRHGLDLIGQFTAVVALGSLAAALIGGGALGWRDPLVLGGFVLSAIAAALFVGIEQRSRDPMLPLQLFRRPMFSVTAANGLLVNITFYGLIFVLSLYFQQVDQWSPLSTGLAFFPMMAMVLPANLIAPRIAERLGAVPTIVLGQAIALVGFLALLDLQPGTPYLMIGPQMLAIGFGLGLLVPPLTSSLLGSADKQHSGIASGVLNSMRQTGSVIGVALFGSLIAATNGFVPGARTSLELSAGILVLGILTVLSAGEGIRTPMPFWGRGF